MIAVGDWVYTRDGNGFLVTGVGPTTDQLTCLPLSIGKQSHTIFPKEVYAHLKVAKREDDCPDFAHQHFHPADLEEKT
jgi:hypothetical protein